VIRITRRLFWGGLLAVLLTGTLRSEGESQTAASTPDEPLAINLDEVAWGPPGNTPRFPRGVRTAQMGTDPDTGGPTYYALFPAGSHFDLHWHTHAEHVAVMSGEVTIVLGDETYSLSAGGYIVIPGKMNHSWDVAPGGADAVILVRRRGPADFNFVEP
jgi:quercetin dioxygenase-like cupin family protein